jgi:ribonucleoside-diphosphate reductase beta chain
MSIFDKRVAFKPFEYPDIMAYKDAINHSYWLVSEWNFLSDIHDFNVKLNDVERHAIKNAMLAISQIEVSVKKFWTKLGDRFPKAEFEQVGRYVRRERSATRRRLLPPTSSARA